MLILGRKAVNRFLIILSLSLISTAAFADEENEPTDENLWRAEQAGDIAEADRIRAILNEEAKKVWGSRANGDIALDLPGFIPPEDHNTPPRPFLWGNDATITTGPVLGGISTDYDGDGNVYAARCTTYSGTENARIRIYKSTDGGVSWAHLAGFYNMSGHQYSYPVVLTGSSGTPDKLYVFYLRSSNHGDLRVARYTVNGTYEGFFSVKEDSDTVTYFSVCADFGVGSYLMLGYQRERMGDTTPNLYTIVSTDMGETWGSQRYVSADASHPDIAYGYGGYVYLVYTKTGGTDAEISACKNTNYGSGVAWQDFEALTEDGWDDDFAKVGALHTSPPTSQHVWVGYNHDYANTGNWDLRFAYSTNAGVNWSKGHILADDEDYDEMACDLWVGRKTIITYVNICYLKSRFVSPADLDYDVYWAFSNTWGPGTWNSLTKISDHWSSTDYDGRKVCQGTYGSLAEEGGWSALVYAGRSFADNFQDFYFDSRLFESNQPPDAFSLLFPADEDSTPRKIPLDWETTTDPDPGDEVTYDLYTSTSVSFAPDSTSVDSNLTSSEYLKTLDYGTYYWKVKAKDYRGGQRWSNETWRFMVTGFPQLTVGDFNSDGSVDVGDVVFAVNYLYRSGPTPDPVEAGDVNCDGTVNLGDVVYLVNYLYRDGPPPCEP